MRESRRKWEKQRLLVTSTQITILSEYETFWLNYFD
jgi:hypothetical protein